MNKMAAKKRHFFAVFFAKKISKLFIKIVSLLSGSYEVKRNLSE